MTSAVIFIRSAEFDPHAARCMAYCEERHYDVVGIVQDDWKAVQDTLEHGAEIVVVSEESHLDPRRRPRIEVVAHQASSRGTQRTRVIRRAWAK